MLTPEMKTYISVLAIIIGFVWYYPYLRDIFLWKTKPHAFSWLIWGVLTCIGFAVQIVEKWGLASWVLGTTAIVCLIISTLGFIRWERTYHWVDWVSLIAAGVSLLIWWWTNNPAYSVIIIAIIDALGFIPTIRKTYEYPHSETLSAWYIADIKIFLGLIALSIYSFNTLFYPSVVFLLNAGLILIIHIRRR